MACDLADLADIVAAAVDAGLPAGVVALPPELDLAPAPVEGDVFMLERLVDNLVQNAFVHGDPRGRALISTGGSGTDSWLRTCNAGAVISTHDVDGLFEPFRRGGGPVSGRGAGLGLSIVKSVVDSHGGHVTAEAPGDGGLMVTVLLPQAAADAGQVVAYKG